MNVLKLKVKRGTVVCTVRRTTLHYERHTLLFELFRIISEHCGSCGDQIGVGQVQVSRKGCFCCRTTHVFVGRIFLPRQVIQ